MQTRENAESVPLRTMNGPMNLGASLRESPGRVMSLLDSQTRKLEQGYASGPPAATCGQMPRAGWPV